MLPIDSLNFAHTIAHGKIEHLAVICKRPQILEIQLNIQNRYFIRGETGLIHVRGSRV